MRYPGGLSVGLLYNARGYLKSEVDALSGDVYRLINQQDARGQITQSQLGSHDGGFTHTYEADYFAQTGQARLIKVNYNLQLLHHLSYDYDNFGNLNSRTTTYADRYSREVFGYN